MKARMMMIALICVIDSVITAVSVSAGVLGVPFDGTHPITQWFDTIGIATGTKHQAIDYAMPEGTLLYARKSGSISVIVDNQPNNWDYETDQPIGAPILGNKIVLKYDDGTQDVFGHCKTGGFKVSVCARVNHRTSVAESGNSGSAKGYHLHHEYWVPINGVLTRVDPTTFDENWLGGNNDPPPDGDTRASLAELSTADLGEGYHKITITSEDRAGKASGVRSIWVWLHLRYHNPEVWIDLGKHFSPNNPSRFTTEYIYDVFSHLEEGSYEIYVTTESGDGRVIERQYSGKNINLNRSTKPPIRIDDRLIQNSNGTVSYWLKSQAEQGRRFVRRIGLWIQAGNRMIPVPPDAGGNESTWLIEPKVLGLEPSRYQLFYYFEDVWGLKTDPLQAANRWFDVVATPQPPSNPQPRLFHYGVNQTGEIWYWYRDANDNRSGANKLDGALANIDAARFSSGQAIVGSDQFGGIWLRLGVPGGFTNWQKANGEALYPPTIIAHNGRVYLLVVGLDGRLYVKSSQNGIDWPWSYRKFEDGWFIQSVTGASYRGAIYLFGVGAGNTVWFCTMDGELNKTNWRRIDGTVSKAVAITTVFGKLYLLAVGMSGELYSRWSDGQAFTNWQGVNGGAGANPAVVNFWEEIHTSLVGTDHCLYYRNQHQNWQGLAGYWLDSSITVGML